MYRFDPSAPIEFSRDLKVLLDHGIRNEMITDYYSVAYWYQEGRSKALSSLPPPHERVPRKPLWQALQLLALMGFALGLLVAVLLTASWAAGAS